MQTQKIIDHIVEWLKDYSVKSQTKGFVVGISGGIDSALTSTLCGLTDLPTLVISLPLRQHKPERDRAVEHLNWLRKKFSNVSSEEVDLTSPFEALETVFPENIQDWLTMANSRSRLRMITLYAFAGHHKMLVTGTGNKVEDFGVGFFTKYGDGGVDISPIADLMKSDVYALASHLGIVNSILAAEPTDGLWADGRTDEDQIGAKYDELEWAMKFLEDPQDFSTLNDRQIKVLDIYERLHKATLHKMQPIPVCTIPEKFR
jgi:NAD+ synthase